MKTMAVRTFEISSTGSMRKEAHPDDNETSLFLDCVCHYVPAAI